jgi:nitroreductase
MEVFDAVRTVLGVRHYQDKPVPEPNVHQIVEAGHLTASSANGQPWHFIIVEDKASPDRRDVGALIDGRLRRELEIS